MKAKRQRIEEPASPLRVNFISLGCAKNLVDSEKMLGLLAEAQMMPVGPDDPAEATLINTCGFIADARQESFEAIEQALEAKSRGRTAAVLVCGCLAQYWHKRLLERYPELDAVVGLDRRDRIPAIVRQIISSPPTAKNPRDRVLVGPFKEQTADDRARLRLTEQGWAYLRISEGCDRGCSFCTIPRIRGPFRSRRPESILAEAAELVADGVLEINLIGQETSGYGADLDEGLDLADLVGRLNRLEPLRWIRVLYAHPATLTDRIIEALAGGEKVAPYLDLPLQHINDRLLKLMNRSITRGQTEDLLQKLRRRIPQLAVRTTLLVGFPGETDEQFEELLQFVQDQRFEALGAFRYSAEAHTRASHLQPAVPDEVKQERYERLMMTQQRIAFDHAEGLIGRQVDCLIGRPLTDEECTSLELPAAEGPWFLGRHARQAPEIDSECLIAGVREHHGDTIVPVLITARRDYDLVGRLDSGE
ncbi:MAG: 30S ribosomal protein S12 methylthiotransferase RimO [Sedimentisphaerales bacterium]|nr:30S ribosomal protein S12 methylthiotransferase RimO [Sedimentisphaerales bacterium]